MLAEQPDQAAGLRRRSARQSPVCLYCFFDAVELTSKLACALQQAGRTALLIDRQGRLFSGASTRSLFDWKQQLERGQLHTLPLRHGEGWHAPGVQADAPALRDVALAYDHLVFDEAPSGAELILMPGAMNVFMIEVQPAQSSMLRAYTLLKTLSAGDTTLSVSLLGDSGACARVLGMANHFLPQPFVQLIHSAVHIDTAFSALAVRMPGGEAGLLTRC